MKDKTIFLLALGSALFLLYQAKTKGVQARADGSGTDKLAGITPAANR